MLDPTTLWPFVLACLALNLTPGADMTYVIARSTTQGRDAGIAASLGIAAGCFAHSLLAALGVSALLAKSATLFLTVKYVGAGYLLYLAWKALRSAGAGDATPTDAILSTPPLGKLFVEGFLTNLLNPKVALFILAFLPQFVDPTKGSSVAQILLLGLIFNTGGTLVNCTLAASAGMGAARLKDSLSFRLWLNRFSALVFVGLALRLALGNRR